jgi:hypothetical protein
MTAGKPGARQYRTEQPWGPVLTYGLWSGLSGSECQIENDGDATVFDKQAQRWVIQQFALGTYAEGTYEGPTVRQLVHILLLKSKCFSERTFVREDIQMKTRFTLVLLTVITTISGAHTQSTGPALHGYCTAGIANNVAVDTRVFTVNCPSGNSSVRISECSE